MKYYCLVPMRGGSKGIPNKNTTKIAGKMLFEWSINAAVKSNIFEAIIVSTDSRSIILDVKKIYNDCADNVYTFIRPPEFATDTASTESVIENFINSYGFISPASDVVLCTLQVTNPLVLADDFIRAKELFEMGNYDTLLTAVKFNRLIWDYNNKPVNYDINHRPRRQDFTDTFVENGSFYFTKIDSFLENKNRLGGKIAINPMSIDTVFELDDMDDFFMIEKLLLNRG